MMPHPAPIVLLAHDERGSEPERIVPGGEDEQAALAAGRHHVGHRRDEVDADEEAPAAHRP